eukprot:COSAG05_NODE_258_length_12741_cov_168.778279_8_plen_423_part_00
MFHLQLLLFALTAAADRPRSSNATVTLGKLMNDTAKFWDAFRDPTTGLYCDHFAFDTSDAGDRSPSSLPHEAGSSCAAAIAAECSGKPSATQCDACAAQHQQELRGAGCTSVEIRQWCAAAAAPLPVCQGKQYSIAACGMGLIATAAFAEMELLSRQEAEKRALQTLSSLATKWPKESFSGFFNHFTNAPDFEPTAEYSTVDTAEMAMGALFAGNYFGGSVQSAAAALVHGVKWTVAIEADGGPTTFPIINGTTGVPIGNIRPYNEYFILAYLAKIMEDQQGGGGGGGGGRANKYWNTYFASTGEGGTGAPAGRAGYPAHASYEGHALLTDNPNRHFMSSFIPQFCFFQTKYLPPGNKSLHRKILKTTYIVDCYFTYILISAQLHGCSHVFLGVGTFKSHRTTRRSCSQHGWPPTWRTGRAI